MKRSVVLFVLLMIINKLSSCPQSEIVADPNIDMYYATYNYIVKNGTKKAEDYVISNITYNLGYWSFEGELADMPEQKKLLDAQIKRHYFDLEIGGVKNSIDSLTKNSKNPKFVIFYSAMEDGMNIVHVVPFDKKRHMVEDINNFYAMCHFTTSLYFLFVFDKERKIIRVASHEMIID